MSNFESLADFFIESNKLKNTIRYTSCPEKIQESTAGHSWQITLMVPIIARELGLDINLLHAMEIANVHDLAEYADTKDYDAYLVSIGTLSKIDKDKSEEAVMLDLKNRFNFGLSLYSLWKEYQEGETQEARFVKALDKIESHFHIIEREGAVDNPENLKYQLTYSDNAVRNFPQLEPLLRIAKNRLRAIAESQGIIWKKEYDYPD